MLCVRVPNVFIMSSTKENIRFNNNGLLAPSWKWEIISLRVRVFAGNPVQCTNENVCIIAKKKKSKTHGNIPGHLHWSFTFYLRICCFFFIAVQSKKILWIRIIKCDLSSAKFINNSKNLLCSNIQHAPVSRHMRLNYFFFYIARICWIKRIWFRLQISRPWVSSRPCDYYSCLVFLPKDTSSTVIKVGVRTCYYVRKVFTAQCSLNCVQHHRPTILPTIIGEIPAPCFSPITLISSYDNTRENWNSSSGSWTVSCAM